MNDDGVQMESDSQLKLNNVSIFNYNSLKFQDILCL